MHFYVPGPTRTFSLSDTKVISFTCVQFQTLSSYYHQEAEWLHNNHKPSFKEQVNVSSISAGAPMLCVAMMVGMGDEATKEVFDWVIDIPDAALASGKIARIMNDIASLKVIRLLGLIETLFYH